MTSAATLARTAHATSPTSCSAGSVTRAVHSTKKAMTTAAMMAIRSGMAASFRWIWPLPQARAVGLGERGFQAALTVKAGATSTQLPPLPLNVLFCQVTRTSIPVHAAFA
jgi:hypothetical protein